MSAPGNTAKLETRYSKIQTAQSCPSLVGIDPTIDHTTESAHYPTMPASHVFATYCKLNWGSREESYENIPKMQVMDLIQQQTLPDHCASCLDSSGQPTKPPVVAKLKGS